MTIFDISRACDLTQPVAAETLRRGVFAGDSEAHRVSVRVTAGSEAADLTGCTASGYFVRSDGATVVLPGEITGDTATLLWNRACYEVPGQFSFILRLTDESGARMTVLALQGFVAMTQTDAVVDASQVIPSLDDLLSQIAAMEEATARAQGVYDEVRSALDSGELDGRGLTILGYFASADALDAIDAPQRGDAYCIGTDAPYDVYIYDGVSGTWINNGSLQSETVTVNGIVPADGDIPLTADDIPAGDATVAAALAAAAARCTPTLLWSGSWSSGTIDVPGVGEWKLLQVATSVGSALCLANVNVQGLGSAVNTGQHRTIGVRFAVSGDTCTLVEAHYITHLPSGDHSTLTATAISSIYGLIRKEE